MGRAPLMARCLIEICTHTVFFFACSMRQPMAWGEWEWDVIGMGVTANVFITMAKGFKEEREKAKGKTNV